MKLRNKLLIIIILFFSLFLLVENKGYCASGDWENLSNFSLGDSLNFNDIKSVIDSSTISSYFDIFDYHYFVKEGSSIAILSSPSPAIFENSFQRFSLNSPYSNILLNTNLTYSAFSYPSNASYILYPPLDDYFYYVSFDVVDDVTNEVVFRQAGSTGGNGGSSSGGNSNTNTTNTTSGSGTGNTNTNSIGNTSGNNSGSGSSSSSDEDHGWLGNILSNIFGGFIDGTIGTLGQIFTGIGNLLSSIGDIFVKLTGIFDFLNPTSENFILLRLWQFLTNIFNAIGDIISWIGNFFVNLLDFVLHLFVPTASQWEAIKSNLQSLRNSISTHIPFWSFVQNTFTEAQDTQILNNDFLVFRFPVNNGFGLFNNPNTEYQEVNVMQIYEPYRVQVRGLLLLVVYASALVYVVKHITDYKANVAGTFGAGIAQQNDNLKSGNRLNK